MDIAVSTYNWAIKRSGIPINEFLLRFPIVQKWIDGKAIPTIKQIQDFAKRLNVPLAYLLLPSPPKEEMPFAFFRSKTQTKDFNLIAHDVIKTLKYRQLWLEEYLENADFPHFSCSESIRPNMPSHNAADIIRKALEIDTDFTLQQDNVAKALIFLTTKAEDIGVYTTFSGIVDNNTHRTIPVDVCRGFALASKTAPFVFVNSADSKNAQMFTLVHELVHVFLGESAGHAGQETEGATSNERFCDHVAAEILVPEELIKKMWRSNIKECAAKFKVSQPMMIRRVFELNLISKTEYNSFFENQTLFEPQKTKESGGDFYATSYKRVGRAFARHVQYAANSGQLSHVEARRLTGLWGKTYDKFMSNL